MALTEEQIDRLEVRMEETLRSVYDPEIPVNIVELGLIYEATVSKEGIIEVLMTLTTPNCPVAESMPQEVEQKLLDLEDVKDVIVEVTFDPPWDRDMMSEEAKFELGFF